MLRTVHFLVDMISDDNPPTVQSAVVTREEPACNVRVVIADDHPIVREAIRKLLTLEEDIEVVGEASNGYEVIQIAESTHPDVVILDVRMPQMDGIAALEALLRVDKERKIILLTASEDKHEFVQAMKLGCTGIVLKHSAPELIVNCIRTVVAGGIWLFNHTPAAVSKQVYVARVPTSARSATNSQQAALSPRQRDIVSLLVQGYKNREIAEKLFVSEQTIKNHLHSIFNKIGVSDRLELVLYAVYSGLARYC